MSGARIAITMGDPAGVGPEIIVKAVHALRPRVDAGGLHLLIVGNGHSLGAAGEAVAAPLTVPAVAAGAPFTGLALLEPDPPPAPLAWGELSPEGGRQAYLAVEAAVRLAQSGAVDAVVTAPLNKEALNLAGYRYPGHTELLAELTGSGDVVLMLVHDELRVSHVSTHIALRDAAERVTPKRLRRVVALTDDALRRLGFANPRIAVAGLNPHAGENGLFGREEIETIAPTVARCRAEGFAVEGPIPGDTAFVKARARQYDAVVAMYHDQGHVAVKLLGFSVDPATGRWQAVSGVNVTLGLPIVRTSVDHGTAFDIAGSGQAEATSLLEAIALAERLGRRR